MAKINDKPDLQTSAATSRREFLKRTYSTAMVGLLFGVGAATQTGCDLPYVDYANYYYDYGYYYNYSYYNYSYYYDFAC